MNIREFDVCLCGEYFDKETGTIYLRARYYDPTIGRFITVDSYLGKDNDPLSLNLYTYAHNNPINLFDPTGHNAKGDNAGEGTGKYYAQEEAESYIFLKLLGFKISVKGYFSSKISGLPKEITYFDGNYTYTYALAPTKFYIYGVDMNDYPPQLNELRRYGYELIYTDEPVVLGGTVSVGNIKLPGNVNWTEHGYKHFPQKNMSWKGMVKSTKYGDARYKIGTDIEALERMVWEKGIPVTNGKTWKVMKFDNVVGATSGVETTYMRVEMSSGTIHGLPITKAEYLRLTK